MHSRKQEGVELTGFRNRMDLQGRFGDYAEGAFATKEHLGQVGTGCMTRHRQGFNDFTG